MKNNKKTISIIVPCLNENEVIPIFYRNVLKELKKINCDYEIIFVYDGSKDNTLSVMENISKKDKNVAYISFSRNFGKEAAMYAGLKNAKGDYVTIMDADLQDPPSLLLKMFEILEKGEYDCAAARRVDRAGESKIRSFFAKAFYKIINKISNSNIADGARDYRLMNRKMVDAVLSMCEYNRFSKGIFSWVGFKTTWIDYENVERAAGTTSWSFLGLVKYAIDGIINFSQVPLDMVSWFGIIMTIISFIMLIFVVIRKLVFGDPVAGWASTISVIIFIGGVQLFSIGIIGQYIGKTYIEVKSRPHYIVANSNIKKIN